MSFTSLPYYFLLLVTLLGYWSFKSSRARLTFLLVASYTFYFEWSYKYSLLLVFSTMLDYIVGRLMASSESSRHRKALLAVSMAGNLGVLVVYKYYNFFVDAFVRFTSMLGVPVSMPVAQLLLPVGLSFYTFQTMSYTIDLYRRKVEPCRSLLEFAVFVAFFPQLVAGPIERATRLLPQIRKVSSLSVGREDVLRAVVRILWGLFKKLVVANSIGLQVDYIFGAHERLGMAGTVLGAIGFSLQIYCDFSAYTDIAIGSARLFGIRITENFRAPYLAANPQEFWHRWHISLSTWFRDYLYIPLGGSRLGGVRTYFNLLAVMAVVGLWHGANYTFVLWGVLHGFALAGHRLIKPGPGAAAQGVVSNYIRALSGWAVTTVIVLAGWILFRAESLGEAGAMFGDLLAMDGGTLQFAHYNLVILWTAVVAIEHLGVEAFYRYERARNLILSPPFMYISAGFLFACDFAFFFRVQEWDQTFIYFAF